MVAVQKQPSRGVLSKGVLKICSKFTGEHPCWTHHIPAIILQHGWSLVNLLHIFTTPFPKNTSGGLLLTVIVTVIDNNAFGFKCNIAIKSSFLKKTQNFSNSVKWNIFTKFQFNIWRAKKNIFYDHYLLESYLKLDGESRIAYAEAIFARFMINIFGVTNFDLEKISQ